MSKRGGYHLIGIGGVALLAGLFTAVIALFSAFAGNRKSQSEYNDGYDDILGI